MGRTYSFDQLTVLDDGASAHAASGFGQVAGANKILDLGGALQRTDLNMVGAVGRIDTMAVLDVSALTDGAAGELATLSIMGSNNSNGSNPVVLAQMPLGYGTSIPNGAHSAGGAAAGTGSDSSPGKYELPFTNEQNGIVYEFVYLYVTIAGGASITLEAYIAPLPFE